MTDANGLAVIETQPADIVRHASSAAEELARVVKAQGLSKQIQGREYLTAEAWGALGEMLDLSVKVDDPESFTDSKGGKGYKCRAHIFRPDGRELSSATAICTGSETRWGRADDYAVYSMAQTRAIGKAYRSRLSFIAVLAGYQPTPAEEMTEEAPARPPATSPAEADAGGGVDAEPEARTASPVSAPATNPLAWIEPMDKNDVGVLARLMRDAGLAMPDRITKRSLADTLATELGSDANEEKAAFRRLDDMRSLAEIS